MSGYHLFGGLPGPRFFVAWVFCLGTATFSPSLFAEGLPEQLDRLSRAPQWLALLYLQPGEIFLSQSDVVSPKFFLARGSDEADARLELEILHSLLVSGASDESKAYLCQFPARSLWLAEQFNDLSFNPLDCPALVNWMQPESLQSIDLTYVGSYLGNPASSFGHMILRLSLHSVDNFSLLDPSINFGADVPAGESSVAYIFNGLTGGYTASFSTSSFYREDLVYSGLEQRDQWNYRLDLSKTQQLMLTAHLWELQNQQFKYYFLRENCAWRIGQVLQAALGLKILPSKTLWYAPSSLLVRLSHTQNPATDGPLVGHKQYRPAPEKLAFAQYRALPVQQQQRANALLANPSQPENAGGLSVSALDFLLAYLEPDAREQPDLRNHLLRLRMEQPATEESLHTPLAAPDPGVTLPPARLAVGWLDGDEQQGVSLSFAPFHNDRLGGQQALGASFVGMKLTVLQSEQKGTLLQRFDLLEIQKHDLITPPIPGERRLSWSVNMAVAPTDHCQQCFRGELVAGLGRAWRLQPAAFFEIFARTGNYAGSGSMELEPGIALHSAGDGIRFSVSLSERILMHSGDSQSQFELDIAYPLGNNYQLRLASKHANETAWHVELARFF